VSQLRAASTRLERGMDTSGIGLTTT
jgi:hypothetical protein